MKLSFHSVRKSQLAVGLVAAAVLVIAGVVIWRVVNRPATPAEKNVQACLNVYDDEDLCSFTGNYNLDKLSYKMTVNTTAPDGSKSTTEYLSDGLGNTQGTASSNGQQTATITIADEATYLKDENDGKWFKFPRNSNAPGNNPTLANNFKFDTAVSEAVAKTVTYKKHGQEACGKLRCLKYQVIKKAQPEVVQFFWFDTANHRLQRLTTQDANGSTEVTVNYQAVDIKAPSPVKEFKADTGLSSQAE